MSIEVTCPQCNASQFVNDRLAGRSLRCPKCDAAVQVPEPDVVVGAIDGEVVSAEADADPNLLDQIEAAVDVGEAAAVKKSVSQIDFSSLSGKPDGEPAGPPVAPEDEDEDDEVLIRNKRPEEEMDMTPMVDVTFLLLIFFMVTAAFSLQKAIEMPRQQTDAPSTSVVEEESEDLDMVEVQVDEFGSFLVMAPDWERETPGKQNLISTLKEAMGNNNNGMRLVIKVHEMAKLYALVDAMDAGTIAGYAQLEVTQVEEFD